MDKNILINVDADEDVVAIRMEKNSSRADLRRAVLEELAA